MTAAQRRRRHLIWRGSFSVLILISLLMLAGAIADRITQ